MQPSEERSRNTYRPDIDGLRAVAVLLVIFNHLHTRFTGGYVGVDVFFVISGYLISAHILSAMDAGTFSIADFYDRRVRRIFPALLCMLLFASVLAYIYYIPSEIESFALSLEAALFSVSNFLFWHEAGYFDAPSALKPLLHTWSLGVEEQFYLIFPPFLLLVRRWLPSRLKIAILTAGGLSFVLAFITVRHNATAAFFSSPLRAWELLIGTALSQGYLPTIRSRTGRNLASGSGLLLILVPSIFYSEFTVFPGPTAALPCAGAALIIAAGETGSSLVGRLLSWRPVVFTGAISYSLYLWHWPILAFQAATSSFSWIATNTAAGKFRYLVVVFVIATLSWWLIETPFRRGRWRPSRRLLFTYAGAGVFAMAALGGVFLLTHGMQARFPPETVALAAYTHDDLRSAWRQGVCFFVPEEDFANFQPATCLAQDGHRPQYLLIGDSHAAALYPGLVKTFPEVNFSEVGATFCPPLATVPSLLLPQFRANCLKMADFLFTDFLLHHHVDTVILAARWEQAQLPELARTITWIQQHGMKVVVVGPSIEYDAPLPRLLITALRYPSLEPVDKHQIGATWNLDQQMAALARERWRVPYISAYKDLCTPPTELAEKTEPFPTALGMLCPAYVTPGVPLLFDSNHFTTEGSALFARVIRERHQL